jgi:molecular chaperone DnaK (HSP70)
VNLNLNLCLLSCAVLTIPPPAPDRQIPTILSYVDGEEYYGQQAKAFLVRNPQNTVAYFRDFLGKEFKSIDPTHNHASAHPQESGGSVSFTVKDQADKEAEEGEEPVEAAPSTLSVSEIATRYLRRLVGSASDYLGKKVTSAVVTVPTNFNDKQKAALIAAAAAADLEVLQVISEPVAAVLAYDARPEAKIEDKIVVVADLGGTRSDVAVVASRGGMYTILATVHDYEFAGVALDKVLMDHFAKEFLKKNSGASDPRENPRSLAKLRLEAESTKRALSLGTNASFSVESLADGIDFASTINRLRYETIARTVFEGINRLVESAVKKAGLDVLDVDEVVLSGGSSHTPRIATNIGYVFPQKTRILAPSSDVTAINPSELGARGAALQASLIQDYEAEDINQSTHAAVTTVPHVANAVGVISVNEAGEEVFVPVIQPDTAVPARRTVHVSAPNGGDVLVKVAEGNTHIKVTKPEPKAKENGDSKAAKVEDADDSDEEDSDFSDDEEEEEKREKVWKIGATLAEAAVKGVKKGGKVEVSITVQSDLSVVITAREVDGKGAVRGTLASA